MVKAMTFDGVAEVVNDGGEMGVEFGDVGSINGRRKLGHMNEITSDRRRHILIQRRHQHRVSHRVKVRSEKCKQVTGDFGQSG